MAFKATILADSITSAGCRLTTFELTFPRCILAEINTHRMLSRNAASSRAIPTEKLIQRVIDDPFIPDFRKNQKGMQAGADLDEKDAALARKQWLFDRDYAVDSARQFHKLDVHKQYVNRLLEPWMWATVIASATDWNNVWHLRCSEAAEPSFNTIACMARDLLMASDPLPLEVGEWHLPLLFPEDRELLEEATSLYGHGGVPVPVTARISAGRCSRVSYLTHDGKRDLQEDVALADRMVSAGHWSGFEHPAQVTGDDKYYGNFRGFKQLRKFYPYENWTAEPGATNR